MDPPRYRREAFEKAGSPQTGFEFWHLVTPAFAGLTLLIVLLLIFGAIPRKETVSGILTLSEGQLKIIPPEAGILTAIYVSPGQEVAPGQVLARISTEQEDEHGTTNEKILAAIEAQIKALQSRIDATAEQFSAQKLTLEKHIDSEVRQIKILEQQRPELEQKLALLRSVFEGGKPLLDQGVISQLQFRDFEESYLDQEGANKQYMMRLEQLRDGLFQDQEAAVKLPADRESALQTLFQEIASLQERYSTALGDSQYVLKAKVSGKISLLQTTLGANVDTIRPIAVIVPGNNQLYAALYVPSRAIGFVRVGQEVRLMYDAYPYQRFGLGSAVVTSVSSTVLNPDEIKANVKVGEPSYLVTAQLSETTITAYGKVYKLQPDMALSADIILEKQSLFRSIFEPLLAASDRV